VEPDSSLTVRALTDERESGKAADWALWKAVVGALG
jgi:hypothetical protein